MSASWHNWADTIDFQVQELDEPVTLADLKTAVANAGQAGRKLRVVGSGHSWSLGAVPGSAPYAPGAQTDANLIDISGMNPVNTAQDAYLKATYFQAGSEFLVAVPPGTTQGWIATNAGNAANDSVIPAPYRGYDPDHLYSNAHPDLALASAGPAPDITLGGFIANGCHGTGWANCTVADLVQAIEVVVWDGTDAVTRSYAVSEPVKDACVSNGVFESTPSVDAAAIDAMRCSLGALGAIAKMVLLAEPSFNVAHINEYVDNDTLWQADYLEQLVTSSEYVEIFWFPYNDQCWVMRYGRDASPAQNTEKLNAFVQINSIMAKLTGGLLGEFFEKFPWLTPLTMNATWAAMKHFPGMRELNDVDFWTDFNSVGDDDKVVAPLWQAYLYQLQYFTNLLDISYTVPIPAKQGGGHDFSGAVTAWNEALAQVEAMRSGWNPFDWKYPVNINIHVRFIKNSPATLSPAQWPDDATHTCYIEFLSFSETIDAYQEYAQVVGPQWAALGGLPHYAKAFQLIDSAYTDANTKLGARGSLAPFATQRTQDDPHGIYDNAFLDDLLGADTGAQLAVQAGAAAAAQASAGEAAPAQAYQAPPGSPAKRFPLPTAAWDAAQNELGGLGRALEGAGTLLIHKDGLGGFMDSFGEIHPLQAQYEAGAQQLTLILLCRSKNLSAGEVFAAIGVVLRSFV